MSVRERIEAQELESRERANKRKKYLKELKAIQKNEATSYESNVMAATLIFLLEV